MFEQYENFKWYLSSAFKDCLAMCRFEQGDTIYPIKRTSTRWGDYIKEFDFYIKVQSPNRTSVQSSLDSTEPGVFERNWNTPVTFKIKYLRDPKLDRVIETSQGVLYTYLWKNDKAIFDIKNPEIPELRISKNKDKNSESTDTGKGNSEILSINKLKTHIPFGTTAYAMLIDYVHNISLLKKEKISKIDNGSFVKSKIVISLLDVIKDEYQQLSCIPTLAVEVYVLETNDKAVAHEKLKNALYTGRGSGYKFKLKNHGLLIMNE